MPQKEPVSPNDPEGSSANDSPPPSDDSQSKSRLDRLVERYRGLGALQKIVVGVTGVITGVAGAFAVGNQAVRAIQEAVEDPPPPARVHVETNPNGMGIPRKPVSGTRQPAVRQPAVRLERDPTIFERGEPDWTGYLYVIPRPAAKVPPPPKGLCRDRARWAYGLGGVDADYTRVQVTIEGNSPGTVLIDAIDAIVEKRRKPLAGVLPECGVGGATGSPRRIDVDLDQNPPAAHYLEAGGDIAAVQPGGAASPVVFTLEKGETETFFIDALTTSCDCEWRVRFKLIAGGKRTVITIPPMQDAPFRTTGRRNAKTVTWENGRWR